MFGYISHTGNSSREWTKFTYSFSIINITLNPGLSAKMGAVQLFSPQDGQIQSFEAIGAFFRILFSNLPNSKSLICKGYRFFLLYSLNKNEYPYPLSFLCMVATHSDGAICICRRQGSLSYIIIEKSWCFFAGRSSFAVLLHGQTIKAKKQIVQF